MPARPSIDPSKGTNPGPLCGFDAVQITARPVRDRPDRDPTAESAALDHQYAVRGTEHVGELNGGHGSVDHREPTRGLEVRPVPRDLVGRAGVLLARDQQVMIRREPLHRTEDSRQVLGVVDHARDYPHPCVRVEVEHLPSVGA